MPPVHRPPVIRSAIAPAPIATPQGSARSADTQPRHPRLIPRTCGYLQTPRSRCPKIAPRPNLTALPPRWLQSIGRYSITFGGASTYVPGIEPGAPRVSEWSPLLTSPSPRLRLDTESGFDWWVQTAEQWTAIVQLLKDLADERKAVSLHRDLSPQPTCVTQWC